MPRIAFVAHFVICLAIASIGHARAEDGPKCSTIAVAQHEVTAHGGGKLTPITREELLFARGLYAASPPVSTYPPGEDGMISMMEDGGGMAVFVERDKACGRMVVSPEMTKLLLEIDKSI